MNKKKILIVPTGGTICTEKGEDKSIPHHFDSGLIDCFYSDSDFNFASDVVFYLIKNKNDSFGITPNHSSHSYCMFFIL